MTTMLMVMFCLLGAITGAMLAVCFVFFIGGVAWAILIVLGHKKKYIDIMTIIFGIQYRINL